MASAVAEDAGAMIGKSRRGGPSGGHVLTTVVLRRERFGGGNIHIPIPHVLTSFLGRLNFLLGGPTTWWRERRVCIAAFGA